ncbi:MAG: serine hydrolase domain-containing protein [Chloroflexota bacterium]
MSKQKRIVQILRIIMPIVGIFCLVAFSPWDGIWAWITPVPDTVQEQVDDAIGHGLDGMIVYVDEAGKPPAFYTAGYNNREDQIPADPQSLFKIASIDKLYVAVSIAKLVADERLSLDDTLADHFPELVGRIENADAITVKLMVQHRSGIPNFTDAPGYWENPPNSSEAALEGALDLPANFEPDAEYGYSNTNYFLLGELIEKVVGYSHWQYIEEEILIPLELSNTYTSIDDVDIDDVMSGYWVGYEPDLKHDPHGTMLATAEDVGIFVRALNDGSLLNDNEQTIYASIYEYGHSGLIPGYQSIARYHRDIDTVVVQFANTAGGTPLVPVFDIAGGTKVMVAKVVYNRIVQILHG